MMPPGDLQPGQKPKPSGDGKNQERPPRKGFGFFFLLLTIVAIIGFTAMNNLPGQPEKIVESEFVAKWQKGEIKSAKALHPEGANGEGVIRVEGEYAEGAASGSATRYWVNISPKKWEVLSSENKNAVKIESEPDSKIFESLIGMLLPVLLIGVLIWFLFLRRGSGAGGPGGVFNFGRSKAKMFSKEDVDVRFADVAGIEEAKEELSEIVKFLKNPQKFTRIGAKIPRGVIMFGPPGCGKTLLAKAIAGEAERPVFSISGSDFVEMFVGVGASRVRDLFKSAREAAPCIVFVDEIDAVGRKRGSGVGGGHDEREQTLNAILVEMDGIGTGEGIIVIAATNRPDVLDSALLRPGRFDRQVAIDLPDTSGRAEIFKVHLSKVKVDDEVDTAELGRATPGFSGADIANLINEAALATVLDDRDLVQMSDLLEARDKVRFGREKRSRVMDEEERKITAYHEAGHTVVQYLTKNTDPVHKVTIIPRGMALGATMSLPTKDRYSLTIERANEDLMVLYGGRIAEEIFCESITTGASNDIERATDLATNMVVKYGFSEKLGPLNFAESEERDFLGGGLTRVKSHSDHTSRLIDEEIRHLIESSYKRAEVMINENKDRLEDLAMALLKYETLDAKDVVTIMEGGDIEEKRADDDERNKRREAARRLEQAEKAKIAASDTPPELPNQGAEPSPA